MRGRCQNRLKKVESASHSPCTIGMGPYPRLLKPKSWGTVRNVGWWIKQPTPHSLHAAATGSQLKELRTSYSKLHCGTLVYSVISTQPHFALVVMSRWSLRAAAQ